MKSIYLSPSAQENNIGVGNYGTEEERMNQLADVIEPILKRNGMTVYRNKPSMNLREIVQDSRSKNADYHLALHTNAYKRISRGGEIHVYSKSSAGYTFAEHLYKTLEKLTPTSDRGIKISPQFYELYYTSSPAALIEIDFHDNNKGALWLMSNIAKIGEAFAYSILDYYNIDYKKEIGTVYKLKDIRTMIDDLIKELE